MPLAAAAVSAAPLCINQKLSGYIALGSGGCTIGNLLFSNFSYSYPTGTDAFWVSGFKGTGTPMPATNVSVTVNVGGKQIQFGANWVVNHYQTGILTLSYTVDAPPSGPIDRLRSSFVTSQSGTENGGPTHTTSAVCTGGTCAPTNFTSTTSLITPTSVPLLITNKLIMDARGSTAASQNMYHLSIIQNQFAQTAGPSAPEPMTNLLTGAGIGALALLRRRKRA